MRSKAPGSSGARVTTRTGAASRKAAMSSRSGSRGKGGWAPRRLGLMKGPSRWAPRMRASPLPASMARRIPSRAPRISSGGAVTVVGKRTLVPWARWKRAIPLTPSSPAMVSHPAPPWTWRSMKPGRM
jgi:hypothetical protein